MKPTLQTAVCFLILMQGIQEALSTEIPGLSLDLIFNVYTQQELILPQDIDGVKTKSTSTLVDGNLQCVLKCISVYWCRSVNLGTSLLRNGRHKCELLSSDQFTNRQNMVKHIGVNHYSVLNPCQLNPCQNGGECIFQDNRQDFRCKCKSGFKGDQCEKVPIVGDSAIPAESCQQIKDVSSSAVSGLYWVKHALTGTSEQIYCDMNSPGTECSNYTMLTDATRNSSSGITSPVCDKTIVKKWYRFSSAIGSMMASSCVPKNRCNTQAPGWLSDQHPTVEQGIVVSKKVCFTWSSNCCSYQRSIRVRNCGKFYIYELAPTPGCNMRYCSAG